MIDALNIATMPIADKVHRHMLASYYALQLDALQAEAKRLGYFFAQSDTAAPMPPVLAERLAWATEYRRKCYLYPNCPESWERQTDDSTSDGYTQEHCSSMLAALTALGIRLQESPQAFALLAAEECRLREKASLPPTPEPSPDSEIEVSNFVSGFFDTLKEPKEVRHDMSTTAKIDFEPGLFDEAQYEETPDLPTIQPKRRTSRAPFIVAGGLLLVLAAAFFAINGTSKPKTVPAMLTEGPQTATGAFSLPTIAQGSQSITKAVVGDSEGFCSGYEAMCSTSTTDKPAETLAKLAAALPVGEAKRYRVKVSVVPLDEE